MKKIFFNLNLKFKKVLFACLGVTLAFCIGGGIFAVSKVLNNNASQIVSQVPDDVEDLPIETVPKDDDINIDQQPDENTSNNEKPPTTAVTSNTALNNGDGLFKSNFTYFLLWNVLY